MPTRQSSDSYCENVYSASRRITPAARCVQPCRLPLSLSQVMRGSLGIVFSATLRCGGAALTTRGVGARTCHTTRRRMGSTRMNEGENWLRRSCDVLESCALGFGIWGTRVQDAERHHADALVNSGVPYALFCAMVAPKLYFMPSRYLGRVGTCMLPPCAVNASEFTES
jgi:hypothetical protein